MPNDANPATALSFDAQRISQIYGVVAPHRLTASSVRFILDRVGIEPAKRSWSDAAIRRCNTEIVNAGVGERAHEGIRASPAWTLPLTRLAHAHDRIESILSAFRSVGHGGFRVEPHDRKMLLRCAVVAGRTSRLDNLMKGDERSIDDWYFLAEPLAEDLLSSLPPPHLDRALTACFHHVIDTAARPEPLIDLCERLDASPETHAGHVAFLRILQGNFEEAVALFDRLPPDARQTRKAVTGLEATRALIATLRGEDFDARAHIDAAIDAQKAGTRKQYVFPDWPALLLSLLSLVRTGSPSSLSRLDWLLESARRQVVDWTALAWFVTRAYSLREGQYCYIQPAGGPHLQTLLDGLIGCWQGDFGDDKGRAWREHMIAFRNRAVANSLAWVAAECDKTLQVFAEHYDDKEILAKLPDPQRLHDRFGSRTLAILAAPETHWEHSLKALERLAHDARKKQGRKRSARAPAKKRLVWDLDLEYRIELAPREQRQSRTGAWSKGRKVALKRLAAEAAKMDFLLPQDRDAAAAISARQSWRRVDYVLGARGLWALAGHPHVFNPAGEPVDIVRRKPELSIGEGAGDRALIQIQPHGMEADGDFCVTEVTPRRCEVTRLTADHERLFEIIPPEGLELPADVLPRVLEAVSGLTSQVRVHSAAGSAATAIAVEADEDAWVLLERLDRDAGLTAALMVEPIPDSGIRFEPGQGGATVFADRAGQQVQAQRDLAAERRAAARLIEHCGHLSSWPTESEPLTLTEPEQCLEFLEQLTGAKARCKWPRGEPLRIVANRSASALSLTVKTAEQWLQASGSLAVDDRRVLDLKQLLALLDAHPGSRFLKLGNSEFLALTGAFRRQLDDLASLASPAARDELRLHPLSALALDDLFDSADLEADDGWREFRARLDAAQTFEADLPSTLRAELRPYQLDGFRWLARLSRWGAGACLADDMGLGKTVQTLAVLLDRAPAGPALVVAPTSVTSNWIDEARRFAPTLNVRPYMGPAASRRALLESPSPFDLYITTYGVLQNDAEQLAEVHWHSAVLDEAQAIKNPSAKRARAARRLNADFRLITTGTPIQNNLMDLFSLFSFANPGLLGSQENFRRNFGIPIERDGDRHAHARLRRLIAPFMLRRLKSDVIDDLPQRTEITLHVTMSPREAALYEVLRQRAVEELEAARASNPELGGGARRVQILAHLTRLRLACCHPSLVPDAPQPGSGSSKLDTFATILDELLENRHKVLVFSQFVRHLKLIEQFLKEGGIAYQYLDGGTPARARAERIAAFQAGQGDAFLISLKAGGFGLNLTAADYVIHMDPWWNPAVEDQASDRAHRIGQTRPVTIYRLVTEGTIEEQIVDLHRNKRDLADRLLAGSDAAGRLNADELLELLRQPLGPPGSALESMA